MWRAIRLPMMSTMACLSLADRQIVNLNHESFHRPLSWSSQSRANAIAIGFSSPSACGSRYLLSYVRRIHFGAHWGITSLSIPWVGG
ncbi:hypothetical protein GGR55DRAFT_489335 [Xylaria sp. FL0064]|nr:hypothetical protein GGR55DRAFT_489335 [Xylaria sp. FL0064]